MKINYYIPIIFLVLFCLPAKIITAQEVLIGLGENVRVPEQKVISKTKSEQQPLSLPFVDDFAKPTNNLPDTEKWLDNNVFINTSFAINPPTIGAATFDAFDKNGKLYPNAGSVVFSADTLTSKPIDLSLLPSDSIYLSFFFQPGGFGDMPEAEDTLIVQYKTKNEWVNVWVASVNQSDSTITTTYCGQNKVYNATTLGEEFHRAQLKIDEPQFLHDGFQLRFINHVSISVNRNAPGRSTTTDHWHLDYVYLDKNRSAADLNLPDVALANPQLPLSTIYESIPATHLSAQEALNELFPDPMTLPLVYRNLGWGTRSIGRNFRLFPLYGSGSTVQYSGGSENIYDGQTIQFNYQAPKYDFTTTSDSAAFEIKSYIVTDNDADDFRRDLRYNDTTSYIQYFRDYYAYDDGTAENGYGLFGNNTANAKVAVQFTPYKTDSIRGVYMYFNRTLNEANAQPFYVTVWSDFNGAPDTVMYTGRVSKPAFKDSLNKYVAYKFENPVFVQKGVPFYVGWTQISDAFLNIGFDRNRNHQDKNFYNIYDTWEPTIYQGSLMIRPIFTRTANDFPDDYESTEPPVTEENSTSSFIIYPNPVFGGQLNIVEDNSQQNPVNAQRVDIYNTAGKLMLKVNQVNGSVDVGSLPSGIYIVRVFENNQLIGSKQIVIAK